jgi:hypothetical protein
VRFFSVVLVEMSFAEGAKVTLIEGLPTIEGIIVGKGSTENAYKVLIHTLKAKKEELDDLQGLLGMEQEYEKQALVNKIMDMIRGDGLINTPEIDIHKDYLVQTQAGLEGGRRRRSKKTRRTKRRRSSRKRRA